jgi:hypothetical protein
VVIAVTAGMHSEKVVQPIDKVLQRCKRGPRGIFRRPARNFRDNICDGLSQLRRKKADPAHIDLDPDMVLVPDKFVEFVGKIAVDSSTWTPVSNDGLDVPRSYHWTLEQGHSRLDLPRGLIQVRRPRLCRIRLRIIDKVLSLPAVLVSWTSRSPSWLRSELAEPLMTCQ